MFYKLSLPLVISLAVVASPAYAFKVPVPAMGKSEASSSVAVPDEAAQEALVKRFVNAQSHSLSAQIAFANAFGLAEQVQLLEAEKLALSSGSINSSTLEKTVQVSNEVKEKIEESQSAQPALSAEAKKYYAEGLVSLVASSLEASKLGEEASNFANGVKGAGAMQAVKLGSKLKSGMWVATQSPSFISGLMGTSKQALTFAKASKITIPKNADALAF